MSARLLGQLWDWKNKPDLSPVEMLVLVYLCDNAEPDAGIVVSLNHGDLAQFACVSVKDAIMAIKTLAERNLIAYYGNGEDHICRVAFFDGPPIDQYPWPSIQAIVGGKYKRIYAPQS